MNFIRKNFVPIVLIVVAFLMFITIKNAKSTFDIVLAVITMILSAVLSISMFYKIGKLISISNTLVALIMAFVFYKNNNIALFLLMLYSIISSVYMNFIAINGQREITNLKFYLISIGTIFVISVIIYAFVGKFNTGVNLILILEFLSFALTALSQTFLVLQSRWMFITFAIKDIIEAILGVVSGSITLVVKNIYFIFTNIVSFLEWLEDKNNEKMENKNNEK